jgi:hypothetical protein
LHCFECGLGIRMRVLICASKGTSCGHPWEAATVADDLTWMHSQCERPVGPLDKSIVGRRSDSQHVIEISASIRVGTKNVLHRRGVPASHSIAGVASCSVGQSLFLQLHVLTDHHDMKVERLQYTD